MSEHYAPLSEVRAGMRIDWDRRLTMSDGVSLAADVFRPDDDQRHPVLLAASPYGKGLPFAEGFPDHFAALLRDHPEVSASSSNVFQVWEYPDPERWVPDGYVCIRIDTRGTGGSEGAIDFFSPRETRDLYEAIEWAGVQPWSNGKVGMLGISYLASNQWQVAALAPPHLAAICPWEGASDFYREYTHHGGLASEFMPHWMPYQVLRVQHGLADAPVSPLTGRRVSGRPVRGHAELAANAIDIQQVLRDNPMDGDYYRDRSAVLEDIHVPVLSSSNWGGMALHARGNFEGFTRAGSAEKWLEVHGLEHWTEFYTDYGVELQHRFFDHFLKGAENGWDATPPVQLKIRTPDSFIIRQEHEWPLARTDWASMHLDLAGRRLTSASPCGDQSVTFTARSEGVTFTTEPFDRETEITGPAALSLSVSSSTADADLFITVHLLGPDGAEVLFATAFEPRGPLAQGWLRMSHRELDPERCLPYRPWHPHTSASPLVPGRAARAEIEIWPFSIVVPVGYRLGLTVAGRDYDNHRPPEVVYGREIRGSGPYWHELVEDRDRDLYAGHTTLHSTATTRPTLLLPVIPPR